MGYKSKLALYNKLTGDFQKTDSGSGYPYGVKNPSDADDWTNANSEKIAHYIQMFPQYKLVWVRIEWEIVKEFEVYQKETVIKETEFK